MAIKEYVEDGRKLYRVRVALRSKIAPSIRVQKKRDGLTNEVIAKKIEKALKEEARREIWTREQQGCLWESLIECWELALRSGRGSVGSTTVDDYVQALRIYTRHWYKRPAKEIIRADVLEVLEDVIKRGKSNSRKRVVKSAIHRIFTWAIDNKMVDGLRESPAQGISIRVNEDEKKQPILTLTEIKKLLLAAQTYDHEWFPIWAGALLTGMRSGELYALEWTDVDFENDLITCQRTFSKRGGGVGPTKGRYYRNIPINKDMRRLLSDLKLSANGRKYVFPRFKEWDRSDQARVLRKFCIGIGITAVTFHTLRACWATQLLRNKVAPIVVMKIGGWKDIKTMERYIRLAGIEILGALDSLELVSAKEAVGKVVKLFNS